eukprot:TRINITY_DN39702_c0_g1_i1.p1 TRINITY_DN39702_c0_g1~~TRINITY_DN39702_c0_g1_i1.p1  ORF type:complete len:605 (+),score=172.95 TRINITY_DN39702_c0_g1_i1:76-1815(+)
MPFGIRNKLLGIAQSVFAEDDGETPAADAPPPPPEGAPQHSRRFDIASAVAQQVVGKVAERDPNGVRVYFFADRAEHAGDAKAPEDVDAFCSAQTPAERCLLGSALADVLADCQERRDQDSLPSSVLVVTAGATERDDLEQVKSAVEQAAAALPGPEALSITFIQVGEDRRAAPLLELLESGLTCEHDVVDVCKDEEMDQEIPDPAEPGFMASGGTGAIVGSLAGAALGAGIYYGVHKYQNRPKEGLEAFVGKYRAEVFGNRIAEVRVRSGDLVDRVTFVQADGSEEHFGQEGGDEQEPFVLEDDEWIVEVRGRMGDHHDAIQFVTNTGRESQEFGSGGGQPYSFAATPNQAIVGLEGDEDGWCPRPLGIELGMCPVENESCEVEVELRDDQLWWRNGAGEEWPLLRDEAKPQQLGCGDGCPYSGFLCGELADPEELRRKQRRKCKRRHGRKGRRGGGRGGGRCGRRRRRRRRRSEDDEDGDEEASPVLSDLNPSAPVVEVEMDDEGRVDSLTMGGVEYEREGASINYGYMAAAGVAGALAGGGAGYLIQKKFFSQAAGGEQANFVVMIDRSASMKIKE